MTAPETIRDEISTALETLNTEPSQFRELSEVEAARVRTEVERVFMNAHDPKWWWEHFRLPTTTARFDDQRAFSRICEVVPEPDEAVWFVAEESQLPFYPVFEATPRLITAVIGECYGFEYYLIAKDYSWLLCETHHDDLIAVGDAIRPRLAALDLGGTEHSPFDNRRQLAPEEAEALKALGYHRRWLDYGVLSHEQLLEQYKAYNDPDGDKHLEHYRIASWAAHFETLTSVSDEELERLIELADDPDFAVVSDIPHRLIRAEFLTDSQFERVAQQLDTEGYLRLVARHRLLRELDSSDGSQEVFDRCIDQGDYVVHEALLEHASLRRQHVAALAERGANKRIRNVAGQLLNSRRFRDG